MEVTKEYLDQQFQHIDGKFDAIDQKFDLIDEKIDRIYEKFDDHTKEIKEFAKEQTEELARMIQNSVVEPMDRHFSKLENDLNVKDNVHRLEKDMTKIKTALHLTDA